MRGALLAMLLMTGCAWLRGARITLPTCAEGSGARDLAAAVDACLARGDALYAERAKPGRLDEALSVYQETQVVAPENPRLLAREARAWHARAYGQPELAQDAYRLAREAGLRCLVGAPDVAGAVEAAGGVFTARAAEAIDADRAECALWTATAWAREIQDLGLEGANIDQRALVALSTRALALAGPPDQAQAAATLGLALALPPAPLRPDLTGAEEQLQTAIAAEEGRLSPRVDLAVLVYGKRGETARWQSLLEQVAATTITPDDPDALEDARAITRARAALSAGAPDPAAWWRP